MGTEAIGDVSSVMLTQSMSVASASPSAGAVASTSVPVQSTPDAASSQAAATPTQLNTAIAQVQAALQPPTSTIEFSIDHSSGQTLVRMVDSQTGSLLRQIPSKEMLAIASSLDSNDKVKGLLLSGKA